MDREDGTRAASDECRVEEPQRVADVAVVGLRGGVSGRRRKSMGRVVVVDRNGVAVRIVSAGSLDAFWIAIPKA